MWRILLAELKYHRTTAACLLPAAFGVFLFLALSGVNDTALQQGKNLGFLLFFVMFMGFLVTLILSPETREGRDRLLALLPLSWHRVALARLLVLLAHWLSYGLLFLVAGLALPGAVRLDAPVFTALAAQTGMVFLTVSFGSLHFDFAWPAFRARDRVGPVKILAALLMGAVWCQLYLLTFIQLLCLLDCFHERPATLFFRLYQSPAAAVALLAAGLAASLLTAVRIERPAASTRA
ncbi:MAG: hypothetical protein KA419_17355 [Acidobacteria bacterium]|nr:hypothetical protein [Acidobacteriota bacterium]